MKITVLLTKKEVMEAIQSSLMDKGFDEGIEVVSMDAVGFVDTASHFQFEVNNDPS